MNLILHIIAALHAATPRVDPALLLAVAKVESDLWPVAPISRPHGGAFPIYCGPLQTRAFSQQECDHQRFSLEYGYVVGANELEVWLDDPYVGGDLRRALLGHGCGYPGIKAGHCGNNYANKVLQVYRELGGSP